MLLLIEFFFDDDEKEEPAECYIDKDYFKEKMERFLSKEEVDLLWREPKQEGIDDKMLCIKVYYMCLVKRRVVGNIRLGYPIKMVFH